jgi:predicted transcriptional regulator of viral defense system
MDHLSGLVSHGTLIRSLGDYKNPRQQVKNLVKKGWLLPVQRGWYVIGETDKKLSLFHVANCIYGPSYISMYSALAFYGLIPEAVIATESVTIKRGKNIENKLGTFHYFHQTSDVFSVGVKSEMNNSEIRYLIARPEKALCDVILHTPKLYFSGRSDLMRYLTEFMRFEIESLRTFDTKIVERLIETGAKKRQLSILKKLISTI